MLARVIAFVIRLDLTSVFSFPVSVFCEGIASVNFQQGGLASAPKNGPIIHVSVESATETLVETAAKRSF